MCGLYMWLSRVISRIRDQCYWIKIPDEKCTGMLGMDKDLFYGKAGLRNIKPYTGNLNVGWQSFIAILKESVCRNYLLPLT